MGQGPRRRARRPTTGCRALRRPRPRTRGTPARRPAAQPGTAYGVPELRPRSLNCSFSGSDSSLHAARSYSWISPPRILRRRIRAARSVTVAVVISSASGGRRFPRSRRGPRACGTAGTPQVQHPPAPGQLLLASASRYISGTTSRDHESCPASWPTSGATAVHFRFSGLDLSGSVLAPCLLGRDGTTR